MVSSQGGTTTMPRITIQLTGIFNEENGYVLARCPELDLDTFAETLSEAKDSLLEIIEAYFETAEKVGSLGRIVTKLYRKQVHKQDLLQRRFWNESKENLALTRIPQSLPRSLLARA